MTWYRSDEERALSGRSLLEAAVPLFFFFFLWIGVTMRFDWTDVSEEKMKNPM